MDVVEKDEEIVLRKSEKKKHKRNKEKEALSSSQVQEKKKKTKHKKSKDKEALSSLEVPTEKKKKKKHKKSKEKEALVSVNSIISNQELEKGKDHIDVGCTENVEHMKKRKDKKNKRKNENGVSCIDKSGGEAQTGSRSSKKRHREQEVLDVEIGEGKKKAKKKRTKLDANIENNTEASIRDVETENSLGSTHEYLRNSKSSHVEVFPSSNDKGDGEENPGNKLIRGKRFTRKEDQILKDAINNYIEAHKLGEEGLDMILHSKKHPSLRYCWREIGLALPFRPWKAVYHRGCTLLTRSESRTWTEDEKAFVLKYYEKHGPDWKTMAQILGKNRHHVHQQWRHIYPAGLRKGRWNQMEYKSLFHSVNKDMQMRVYEEKYSKHGMIRDNICWKAVGDCLTTRTDTSCCRKWYRQLSSSMVKRKEWADTDDYRLLDELVRLDACCVEDVDWDNLLEHRSGDISLKRWRQMVNHIGEHGLQSFAEQVEVLAKRYCPELLEVREALDSRPVD